SRGAYYVVARVAQGRYRRLQRVRGNGGSGTRQRDGRARARDARGRAAPPRRYRRAVRCCRLPRDPRRHAREGLDPHGGAHAGRDRELAYCAWRRGTHAHDQYWWGEYGPALRQAVVDAHEGREP